MSLSPADTVDVLLRIRTEGREQLDSLEKAARGVTAAGKEEQTVFQALQATMKEFSASVSGVTGALNVNSQALQAHQANSRNVVSSNGRTASSMTEARHAIRGMGEELGIHMPRFVSTYLTSIEGVAPLMASAFSVVGNHDKRRLKRMADGMPDEVLDYFREMVPAAINPIELVIGGLKNVKMAKPIMCGDASYDYLWQCGDMVVGHPESYSKIPVKGAGLFCDWIMKTAVPAGIIKSPVKLVLQGHTHGAGLVWNDYGIWAGETGCMCRMGDYTSDPKLRTPRPWCPGHVVTEQIDGVTDINSTRFVSLN